MIIILPLLEAYLLVKKFQNLKLLLLLSGLITLSFMGLVLQNMFYFVEIDINILIGIVSIVGIMKICIGLYFVHKSSSN